MIGTLVLGRTNREKPKGKRETSMRKGPYEDRSSGGIKAPTETAGSQRKPMTSAYSQEDPSPNARV